MNVVQQIAGRVAVMSAGRVVESGDVYDVFAAPQQPVTKRFIATALSGLPEEDRSSDCITNGRAALSPCLSAKRTFPAPKAMNSRHPDRISPNSSPNTASNPACSTAASTRSRGPPSVPSPTNSTGPAGNVDEFLRELAANSDVIDFGTAAKPVAYADAVAGHAPTPKTAPMTHWRPILPPRPPRPPPHMKEPTHDHPRQPA